ncbi:MAG: hypothetical protein MAG581_01937 [Deltaproteobacteria bacterium]|nr:hypothetical protein [Deltaproteobacteria bacterium]
MRVWIALIVILLIWVSQAYPSNHFFQLQPAAITGSATSSVNSGGATSINFNFSFPFSYQFTGKDYNGNEFETDESQGYIFNVGFTRWGIGFEIYETKLKNTSEEVKLKTNLYDVTYGATGALEEIGWFWKYVGLGYGFGTDELTCSFCETNFYKGFAMQYILLFNIPITKSFNLKTSYHLKTSKIRHKYKSEADDYSATIINVGIGF